MPLFGKKQKSRDSTAGSGAAMDGEENGKAQAPNGSAGGQAADAEPKPASHGGDAAATAAKARPKLVFHCQKAHGSPTGMISGFTNVKELYQKIAETYEMPPSEILFCTLNTHKVDMSRLLGGQIGLEDFIFAHCKGQKKVAEITKSEDALGLTITDNGAGYAFIKRIKEGSIMDNIEGVTLGDQIEKINDDSMVGCRHFEVAKKLKEIPKGSVFTMRMIEPMKSGFYNVASSTASAAKKSGGLGTGKETLRLRSKGPATVEVPDDVVDIATDKINNLLESFMGINDTELSQTIWEIGSQKENPHEFAVAMDESDLGAFGFTDDFIFDLWGAISDAKQGRLKKAAEFNEHF